MTYCSNCGAEVEGRFCAKCGTQVSADPGPVAAAPPPMAAATGLTDNMAAALCYALWILTGILFLVLEPYSRNKTIRFHAFQAIFAFIALMILDFGIGILSLGLLPIPFIGVAVAGLLHFGFWIGTLILWLMLMYKAYNNERLVLPIIGPLAEKQA